MKINNTPNTAKRYIVAREVNDELWFWGSWDDRDRANQVAIEIGGIVIENN